MVFIDFSTSEPPKFHKKSIPKSTRKKNRKKRPKNRFLHPFWLPKPSQNPSKIVKNQKKTPSKKSSKKEAMGIKPQTPHLTEKILQGPPPDHPTIIPLISTSPSIRRSIRSTEAEGRRPKAAAQSGCPLAIRLSVGPIEAQANAVPSVRPPVFPSDRQSVCPSASPSVIVKKRLNSYRKTQQKLQNHKELIGLYRIV